MTDPAIELQDVAYAIGGRRVLDGISMQIMPGEIVSVMGSSGSGKTTLLKLMTGLIRATSGAILVQGSDITGMREDELDQVRLKMGLVFQYAALFDSMNVYDNILFGVTQHRRGLKRNERDEIVTRRLAQVDMAGVERLFPDELSGGMQKRVGLARALAMEPNIVFYDEPTSGLDPITSRTIDELIVATRGSTGVTSVIVSHDIGSVFRISDRVAMLHGGKLVIFDTPDMLRRSTIPAVREFVSTAELAPAGAGGN